MKSLTTALKLLRAQLFRDLAGAASEGGWHGREAIVLQRIQRLLP